MISLLQPHVATQTPQETVMAENPIQIAQVPYSRDVVIAELYRLGYTQTEVEWWDRIAYRESRWVSDQIVASGPGEVYCAGQYAIGLFQIMPCTWEGSKCVGNPYYWLDQVHCVDRIYRLYGGPRHWGI